MDQFLQFCRFNLSNVTAFKKLSIIIGNESCDLDSAVSSIVLAYIKYHELTTKHQNDDDEYQDDSEVFVLPVLNVFREDLHLRREIVFWFEKVLQFELDWLICRDEIDYDAINSSSVEVFISLVDHNDNKEFRKLLPQAKIDEIIDHHEPISSSDPSSLYAQCDPSKIQIDTTAGSCCSLVALRYFKSNITEHKFGSPVKSSSSETFDSQIALILYGPILLDTICFSHSAGRFNAKDYEAINKLEDLMKHPADLEPSLYDRNEVYQRLVAAKNSLDGLSFEDLLRKDMKIVESISDNNLDICISSITGILLTEMSLRDKFKELKNFCNEPPKTAVFSDRSRPRMFNAIILMSLDNRIPNNLRRQLAIFCTNKHLMRTIATCIERSEQLSLELITALESLRIYNQNNLKASRKVVLPIISTILNGPGANGSGELKRNDSVTNGNGESIATSAPSSFIQQPDSYYGSFIDDSFVGEFVGNYPNATDQIEHENILVMDPNGKNLIIMNPAVDNLHSHEMEFDFESFGPESIMYAENNVQPQQQQQQQEKGKEQSQSNQQQQQIKQEENIDPKNEDVQLLSVSSSADVKDNFKENEEVLNKQTDDVDHDDNHSVNNDGVDGQQQVNENKNSNISNVDSTPETTMNDQSIMNDNDSKNLDNNVKQSQQLTVEQSQQSFSRNSTLTRSQRKKVLPQMNVKNLILNSDVFSPPPIEQIMTPPLIPSNGNAVILTNGNNSNGSDLGNENSSQQHSPPKILINDPLGVYSNNNGIANNANSTNTLGRNQTLKKKIEVNYALLKHDDDKSTGNLETINIDSLIDVNDSASFKDSNAIDNHINANGINVNNGANGSSVVDGGDNLMTNGNDPNSSPPISAIEFRSIDMQVIEPYKKVLMHGGHLLSSAHGEQASSESSNAAIILFSAYYLPDRSRSDYNYVMDNLFLYVVNTLHNMVDDDYILIYLNYNGNDHKQQHSNNMPTFSWLKRCYQMIDRKLKKNLKGLYLVHPTFWLKTMIIMSKPFISSKFSRKLKFVRSMDELKSLISIDEANLANLIQT